MRVLVTGAAGRVGANVVSRLVADGITVRALVLPSDPHAQKLAAFPRVEVVEGDLRDQQSVDRACVGVTHVVHLAASMILGDMPVDEFYDINAFSTLRLLEGALRNGAELERFVLASTDSTYRPADPPATPLTEDVPQVPADYYGTSKLLGEIILRNRAEQYDIPYAIVRFGTVLSPDEADTIYRLGFLRGWVATQQQQGRSSTLWPLFDGQPDLTTVIDEAAADAPDDTATGFVGPDGPWTLSAVDVRDAAQGVHRALTAPGAVGRAFNIAAALPMSSDESATTVADLYGVPKLLVRLPFTWRMELSIDAARRHLGYEPEYDYRSTLLAARSDADSFIPAAEGNTGVLAGLSGGNARSTS